jgi:hypothetical protein
LSLSQQIRAGTPANTQGAASSRKTAEPAFLKNSPPKMYADLLRQPPPTPKSLHPSTPKSNTTTRGQIREQPIEISDDEEVANLPLGNYHPKEEPQNKLKAGAVEKTQDLNEDLAPQQTPKVLMM